jgi:hypothetical protein
MDGNGPFVTIIGLMRAADTGGWAAGTSSRSQPLPDALDALSRSGPTSPSYGSRPDGHSPVVQGRSNREDAGGPVKEGGGSEKPTPIAHRTFKSGLWLVDLPVTRRVAFSLGYGSRPCCVQSGELYDAMPTCLKTATNRTVPLTYGFDLDGIVGACRGSGCCPRLR